jgi:hypothetical protein
MPDNDHQARSTRFSKDGTTVFVRLRVTRKGHEYARHCRLLQDIARQPVRGLRQPVIVGP